MSFGDSLSELVDVVIDGRYHILHPIAEGGMSAVFEAEQLNVSRRVAIKVLKPEISRDPDMLARFRAEAQIISELRHPNTLKLFDYGSLPDGRLYLVTELLSGEPLSARLKRGPLSVSETLKVLTEVLRSLDEAHGRGIVHRDLKPGNLYVEEVAGEKLIRVLDFGIAKIKIKGSKDPEQPTTAEGLLLGTPAYLSPEQAGGQAVDARSDIYSLGAVAYHCLSGQLPFPGEPVAQIMAHVSQTPTPFPELGLSETIPDPMARLVYRWMSKKPSDRPLTAKAALQEVLDVRTALHSGEGPPPSIELAPTKPKAQGWLATIGVVLIIFALVGLAKLSNLASSADGASAEQTTDAATAATTDADPIAVTDPADAGPPAPTGHAEAVAVVDAGVTAPRGLHVLSRPISDGWSSPEAVHRVLDKVEPVALDCYRRAAPASSATSSSSPRRTMVLTFVVGTAVDVQVQPRDEAGLRFRTCLRLRLPRALRWPDRTGSAAASLVIGYDDDD